jgi:hypothetical protein
VVRVCDTALYAASARGRAIACSSTVTRPRCNSNVYSDGRALARRKILGIPAECLTAFPLPARLADRVAIRRGDGIEGAGKLPETLRLFQPKRDSGHRTRSPVPGTVVGMGR